MFNGNGMLKLDGDYLDISFRDPDSWPNMTEGGAIKSFMFDFGDPEAGPVVQLGLMRKIAGDDPNWDHVDPPHYHGSDQFRVVSGGEWELAGQMMHRGSFSFQESGRIYREHPGPNHDAWVALVIGDRRGVRPTMIRKADGATLLETGTEYDIPLREGEAYPHPAGPKGEIAIATTAGSCDRGYLRKTFADLAAAERDAFVTGVFGDKAAGPVAHLLKYGPDEAILPACSFASEILLVVSGGSLRIGKTEYRAGDMRIQNRGAPFAAVTSGSEGVEAAFVIADRRARPAPVQPGGEIKLPWVADTDRVVAALSAAA